MRLFAPDPIAAMTQTAATEQASTTTSLTANDFLRTMSACAPVMPIITIADKRHAIPLAQALVAGGVTVFEVVLRTPQALAAITEMRRHVPQATVGAGTLLAPADVQRAVDAGAQFGVTPALSDPLAQALKDHRLPTLPGVYTAHEVLHALNHGFEVLKLFPANGLQGATQIEQLTPVFPRVLWCPTGGIKQEHIERYLSLKACATVGGSWVTPAALMAAGDWVGITALARQASAYAAVRARAVS
jgi:2-dehydro-3-deoxyphosphogluconate aldolase / (4S)-4-hydroxy-2-oxoglutarate aldolase